MASLGLGGYGTIAKDGDWRGERGSRDGADLMRGRRVSRGGPCSRICGFEELYNSCASGAFIAFVLAAGGGSGGGRFAGSSVGGFGVILQGEFCGVGPRGVFALLHVTRP